MKWNGNNLFSFMKSSKGKFTCPYCYAEHSVTDCGLKCSYNIIGNTDKKCKFDIKKYDDQYGKDWIPFAYKKKCINCKEAAIQLYCPEVGEKIPIEFLSMKSLPIVLLGTSCSGKSVYFGVLVNEIQQKMNNSFNCSLSMIHFTKDMYDELYYHPLYQARCMVAKTREVPPLMFPLRFMDTKNRIINQAILSFYDTMGEIFVNDNMLHMDSRYITNAHGIFLFLDPLQVPNIRNKLMANGFNNLPNQNTEIYDVLSIIIDVIRRVKNIKGLIQIPLALVFTKIDILEQYNILPADSCLREESEHIKFGAFIRLDSEKTNIQIQDLIDNLVDADLMGYIRQFKQYSFFGVSSLGGNPNGVKIDSKGIRPRRVLDPLLWLLAEKGYIKTLKK